MRASTEGYIFPPRVRGSTLLAFSDPVARHSIRRHGAIDRPDRKSKFREVSDTGELLGLDYRGIGFTETVHDRV